MAFGTGETLSNASAGTGSSDVDATDPRQPKVNEKRGSKRKSDFDSVSNMNINAGTQPSITKTKATMQPPPAPGTNIVAATPRLASYSAAASQRSTTGATLAPSPPTGPKRLCVADPRTGNTGNMYLQNALTNARNVNAAQSQASAVGSQVSARPPLPTGASSQFAQMSFPTSMGNFYNPSLGPSQSMVSTNWRFRGASQSQTSNRSFRQGINNGVCKLSGYTRLDFRKGDVISLPFHTANSNPNVDPNTDRRWIRTIEGPAYSKRRMMVVMWIHDRDVFCLPLYTFAGNGLSGKAHLPIQEFVCMKNVGDQQFVNQGVYPPVEVQNRRMPMDRNTSVYITGGLKVACNEDIAHVGRMTRRSHADLLSLWKKLSEKAQQEPWRD